MCVLPGLSGLELQSQRVADLAACAPNRLYELEPSDIEAGVQAMKAGAVDFLTKPVNDKPTHRSDRAGASV